MMQVQGLRSLASGDVGGWWGRVTGSTTAVADEFVYVVPGLHYSDFRVTELGPARRVAWQVTGSYLDFIADKQEWNGTTVRFDIKEDGQGTRVTFTHEGLEQEIECYGACSNAWQTFVGGSLVRGDGRLPEGSIRRSPTLPPATSPPGDARRWIAAATASSLQEPKWSAPPGT
ncbi:MAG: SRPBCC domain-containing protein [Burkholderiaceae bacterium]|nr:SRPBCC domain-containing protein [Microbacteriaceae bacterium]